MQKNVNFSLLLNPLILKGIKEEEEVEKKMVLVLILFSGFLEELQIAEQQQEVEIVFMNKDI